MVTAITIAAFLSTTAISLAPNVILFLFPNYQPSKDGINALDIGQALAAGMYTYAVSLFFLVFCERIMQYSSNDVFLQS